MADKIRPLRILKYLLDHTDEEHPATIADILKHLEALGIHTNRKTVASDLRDLQESGYDLVHTRSRQNHYFIGSRRFELAELKMIVDAIQAAKFRVDRMRQPRESSAAYHPRPDAYDIGAICDQVFMMYDGDPCTVTLCCANEVMKTIIDRFGEDVKTAILDDGHFSAEVEVSASPTFYSWFFILILNKTMKSFY